MERCRELAGGWGGVNQVSLWTDRVHSRVIDTCYAGVWWNDVGNLLAIGMCHAVFRGALWNIGGGLARVAWVSLWSVVENSLEIWRPRGPSTSAEKFARHGG